MSTEIVLRPQLYHPCRHKNLTHHSVVLHGHGGTRIWRCSYCGSEGPWSDDHSYHGNMECPKCGTSQIDRVHCGKCVRHDTPEERP